MDSNTWTDPTFSRKEQTLALAWVRNGKRSWLARSTLGRPEILDVEFRETYCASHMSFTGGLELGPMTLQ